MMEDEMDRSFEHSDAPLFDLGDAVTETKGPPADINHDLVGLSRTGMLGLNDE
jgi:hypothetical protein